MRLTPSNGGYTLESSSGSSVSLTTEEALELAPIARQIQDHIRSRYPRAFPVHSQTVQDVVLSLDAHHTQILLRVVGPDGLEVSYGIACEAAKLLRDGLGRKIEQIEAAQQKRRTQ